MPCEKLWYQINQIDKTLNRLGRLGLPISNPANEALHKLRGELMGKLGIKTPRGIVGILKLAGLSPGTLSVFYDAEGGWLAEARGKAGAPPARHYIDEATAVKILSGGLDHELEAKLMAPDVYAGE